jgi:Tol biopolymer transport system component
MFTTYKKGNKINKASYFNKIWLTMKNIRPLLILLSLAISAQIFAQGVELTNLKTVNTERLDFNPVPFGNGIIFTSSKSDRFLRCPSDNPGDYTDIFYAERNADGSYSAPVKLKGSINGKYNDGVATFNPTGDKMIFTRNNTKGKNTQNVIDLKLYSADLTGGDWVNVTELPFNSDDFSTCHPTLSADGKTLVFASNRQHPDAQGGMDLYASYLVNGNWSDPVNLGPSVNSKGNELFPNFDKKDNLFFSSNGHPGEGGLDIFAAKRDNGNSWKMLGNIGTQFNTASDEVSFLPTSDSGDQGFISAADRAGGSGYDDMFAWKRKSPMMDAIIVVIDEDTGEKIGNANVAVEPINKGLAFDSKYGNVLDQIFGIGKSPVATSPLNLLTNLQGSSTFQVYSGGEYQIRVTKEGFQPALRNPNTQQLTADGEYIIPIRRNKGRINVTVLDDATANPIPGAMVTILDKTTGKTITLNANSLGAIETDLECSHVYEIKAARDNYFEESITLNNFMNECASGRLSRVIRLKAPLVVYLDPVFFDFDKYNIRKDARTTLDGIFEILNKYPSLKIHLGAHCDARGTTTYNDKLSVRRAKSAKTYLLGKGIKSDRVSTEAFGERKPANDCTDNVFCDENQHQLNRRVDVYPTEHQEIRIEFKSRDPKSITIETPPDR